MTDNDLLLALRDCYDPATRRNIVELNLVHSATLSQDREAPGAGIPGVPARYRAEITLTTSSSDAGQNAQLVALIENRLAGIPAISHAIVTLLPPAFPILNSRRG